MHKVGADGVVPPALHRTALEDVRAVSQPKCAGNVVPAAGVQAVRRVVQARNEVRGARVRRTRFRVLFSNGVSEGKRRRWMAAMASPDIWNPLRVAQRPSNDWQCQH